MTDRDILDTLTRIVRDLVGDDTIVLTAESTGEDVPGWDSSTYVNFIVSVEMELGVRFPLADVEAFKTFGQIADAAKALRK